MRNFSKRVSYLRTSEIRNLMKLASDPNYISFAGGMPNNDLFPIPELDDIYVNLQNGIKKQAFQYGPTQGYPPLVSTLSDYLRNKGLPVDTNKILITTGSLQAINILAKILIDPFEYAITENPCFIGAISVFKSYQAEIQSISIDENGIDITYLEKTIQKLESKAKLIYITPYFHNPAGIIYSQERKKQLFKLCKSYNLPVIEDDPYGEIYFEDKELVKPIKSIFNDSKIVCYTGSFSKIIAPGIRLGWLLVPEDIYEKAELVKQSMDACSPTLSQVLANEFIIQGKLSIYTERIRKEYKKRKDVMVEYLNKYMPDYVKWVNPKGGFYIWIDLPEKYDATDILKKCIDKGTVFVIGKTFDPAAKKNNCLRLAYSHTNINNIEKGIKTIAEVIKKM